jgi:uncharacterized protein (DUF2236 family)
MTSGFFTPGTVFWRINSDALINLGLARALLLEIAHPLVAAGVADHSDYSGDRYGRLARTLKTITGTIFGDPKMQREALRHFHGCHHAVKGQLVAAVGPFPAATHYSANDPMLKLWVMGTALESYLLVYERFVAPLAPAEQDAFYADAMMLGQLFGIPKAMMPPTIGDFFGYMRAMIASDVLTVGETAHRIANTLFMPPVAQLASFVSIGLLPERLRNAFGFDWNEKKERRLNQLAAASRRLRPLIPDVLATNPRALIAQWQYHRRPVGAVP